MAPRGGAFGSVRGGGPFGSVRLLRTCSTTSCTTFACSGRSSWGRLGLMVLARLPSAMARSGRPRCFSCPAQSWIAELAAIALLARAASAARARSRSCLSLTRNTIVTATSTATAMPMARLTGLFRLMSLMSAWAKVSGAAETLRPSRKRLTSRRRAPTVWYRLAGSSDRHFIAIAPSSRGTGRSVRRCSGGTTWPVATFVTTSRALPPSTGCLSVSIS